MLVSETTPMRKMMMMRPTVKLTARTGVLVLVLVLVVMEMPELVLLGVLVIQLLPLQTTQTTPGRRAIRQHRSEVSTSCMETWI